MDIVLLAKIFPEVVRIVAKQNLAQCFFCGSTKKLRAHYIIPIKLGGTSDQSNLVVLCEKCEKKFKKLVKPLIEECEASK